MDKLLSISVASYNVEKTLAETLDSFIVPLVMDKIEVIIVNDGSKDRTLEIAKHYEDKYPGTFVVVDKQNGGHGSTINASMSIAKGKYFKIVDGDDWVYSENLSKLIDILDKCDADIVTTTFDEYNESDSSTHRVNNGVFNDGVTRDIEEYLGKRRFAMHEMSVKTSLLQKNAVRITEKCFYVDHEFMQYSIGYAKTLSEYDVCIYKYRIGFQGQSVSPENRVKRIGNQETVLFVLLDWLESNGSELTDIKILNCKQNITNMLSYILESYSFFDMKDSDLVKCSLKKLWNTIRTEYTMYKIDNKGVAFNQGEQVGVVRKVMFMLLYLLIISDFEIVKPVLFARKCRISGKNKM